MVILVDTNIILDVLQKREPFYADSKDILTINEQIPNFAQNICTL